MERHVIVKAGRLVVCDACNEEWTNRPESGGAHASGYTWCPECATDAIERARGYGESIDVCPEGTSFADWVRDDLRPSPEEDDKYIDGLRAAGHQVTVIDEDEEEPSDALEQLRATHVEHVSWRSFLRELERATGRPAADPGLDPVLRAAARWGEELACLRHGFHDVETVVSALASRRAAFGIPEVDDDMPEDGGDPLG